jgi:hypothetical protein
LRNRIRIRAEIIYTTKSSKSLRTNETPNTKYPNHLRHTSQGPFIPLCAFRRRHPIPDFPRLIVHLAVLINKIVQRQQSRVQLLLADIQAVTILVSDFHLAFIYTPRLFIAGVLERAPAVLCCVGHRTFISYRFFIAEKHERVQDGEEDATIANQPPSSMVNARRGYTPLCKLRVMIPAKCHLSEAIPLGHDIQKHEQGFFDGDLPWQIRISVVHAPVGEPDKCYLVHAAEVIEAVGESGEQTPGTLSAR